MMRFGTALIALLAQTGMAFTETTEGELDLIQEKVAVACKDKFLNSIGMLHPADKPIQALDDLTINVCMAYSGFLPRKYTSPQYQACQNSPGAPSD